jgi:hypothetical protein
MSAWPLERVLFALTGCPASLILRRACRLRSALYPAKELDPR